MKIIFTIFLLFSINVLLFVPYPANACSCTLPGSPQEELQRAAAVFSGTVIGIKKIPIPKYKTYSSQILFYVEQAWKGVSSSPILVSSGPTDGMCGYRFEEGEQYIVYAYGTDEKSLETSICSRTNKRMFAHEDIKELGQGDTEFAQGEAPQGFLKSRAIMYRGRVYPYDRLAILGITVVMFPFVLWVVTKRRRALFSFFKRYGARIAIGALISALVGVIAYESARRQFVDDTKKAEEQVRSVLSEEIADLKIENRKLIAENSRCAFEFDGVGLMGDQVCAVFETGIKAKMEDANYCATDADCTITQFGVCPFGCYSLVSKDADTTVIREAIAAYAEKCLLCKYECTSPPLPHEIKCRSNKCVDGRLNSESASAPATDKQSCEAQGGLCVD